MPIVWLNGEFIDDATASVSLRDTGLLHGAGVFTTMRSHAGKVFRLPDHLRRLRASCEALFIPLQYDDDTLAASTTGLLAQSGLTNARLRLTVTRGSARQDPLHGVRLSPNVFITAIELEPYSPDFYERGLTVILLDDQKLNPYDLQAGHKTLNYLSRLAALRSAAQRGAGEALWFNVHNYLQSGSISNVFIADAGKIVTPPTPAELREPQVAEATPYPKSAVLPGITRQAVLDLAAAGGIEVETGSINVTRLLEADEVFLTNSIMGVMPVCRIERTAVSDEQPGPITRRLSELYAEAVARETGG